MGTTTKTTVRKLRRTANHLRYMRWALKNTDSDGFIFLKNTDSDGSIFLNLAEGEMLCTPFEIKKRIAFCKKYVRKGLNEIRRTSVNNVRNLPCETLS